MIHLILLTLAGLQPIHCCNGLAHGYATTTCQPAAPTDSEPAPDLAKPSSEDRTVSKQEFAAIKTAFSMLQTAPAQAAENASDILNRTPALPENLQAHVYWIKGSGLSLSEHHSEALLALNAAETILRSHDDPKLLRRTLRFKAASAFECGQFETGRAAAAEAILISTQLKDQSAYVSILHNELAVNEIALGNVTSAIENLRRAIDISQRTSDRKGRVKWLISLGNLLCENGYRDRAADCFRKVIDSEAEAEASNSFPLAAAHAGLGNVLVSAGDLVTARQHLVTALELCDQPCSDSIRAAVESSFGNWEVAANNHVAAEEHYQESLRLYARLKNSAGMADVTLRLRQLECSQDIATIREQLKEARESGVCGRELSLLYELAEVLGESNQWQEASSHLVRAAELERGRNRENISWNINRELELMDRDELVHLQTEVEGKLAEIQSHRWWYTGLTVCVVALLFILGASIRLLYDKKRMVRALSAAHSKLEDQKALQLRMERQLARQRKSQSLESMASGIAHDFNNLLTGIAGLAELASRAETPDKKNELLQQITSTSIEASGLTGQLRQFLGQPSRDDAQCDLGEVFCSTIRLLESLCRPRKLIFESQPEQLVAKIDATRIRQVLVNLISNATEATPSNGTISIKLTTESCNAAVLESHNCDPSVRPGDFRRFQIADNGHGLTEEERMRIFDPYFSTRGVGRGLGLSSVAGIIRSVGGFITVETNPGEGCRFSVFVPAATAVQSMDSPRKSQDAEQDSRPKSAPDILIVDDESLILDLQEMSLTQAGMRVTVADSAEKALRLAVDADFRFDCVVTDYSMPGHNGRWLARQLKTHAPGLPIILCSGFADDSMEAGRDVTVVLPKPYAQKDLVDAIFSCLNNQPSGAQLPVAG